MLNVFWRYRKPLLVVIFTALAVYITVAQGKDEDEYNLFDRIIINVSAPLQQAVDLVLDRFAEDDVLQRNRQRAAALTAALAPLQSDPRIEHFRRRGMIWAFDVREAFVGERFAERFHLAGRERELLIRPIGRTVYLMPPYVLDDGLAAWLAQRVVQTLDAVAETGNAHADRTPEPPTA